MSDEMTKLCLELFIRMSDLIKALSHFPTDQMLHFEKRSFAPIMGYKRPANIIVVLFNRWVL